MASSPARSIAGICACKSNNPGRTYFPVASIIRSPVACSDRPLATDTGSIGIMSTIRPFSTTISTGPSGGAARPVPGVPRPVTMIPPRITRRSGLRPSVVPIGIGTSELAGRAIICAFAKASGRAAPSAAAKSIIVVLIPISFFSLPVPVAVPVIGIAGSCAAITHGFGSDDASCASRKPTLLVLLKAPLFEQRSKTPTNNR